MTSLPAAVDQLKQSFRLCRKHFIFAALFSGFVNLLYIAPTLYMLQVYDRVVPTRGLVTLFFLTIVLLGALVVMSQLGPYPHAPVAARLDPGRGNADPGAAQRHARPPRSARSQ
jgi:hypothetical protein